MDAADLSHMVSVGLYLMHSLHSAEVSLDTLAQAIAEKSSELQASYAKRQSLELAHAGEAARTQEREHLLREMHDGICAQLMLANRPAPDTGWVVTLRLPVVVPTLAGA